MSVLTGQSAIVDQAVKDLPHGQIWGMTVQELHDRYWASRGVQVIRTGGSGPDAAGPRLCLLVHGDELIDLDVQGAMKRMNWAKPQAMRVRIVDSSSEPYVEQVTSDADGRFVAVRREYGSRTRKTTNVWLTADPGVAVKWSRFDGRAHANRSVRDDIGRENMAVYACAGRIAAHGVAEQSAEFGKYLQSIWLSPEHVVAGIYQYQPGVWVHESTDIDATCRFIAPVWLGAGAHAVAGEVVVGPWIEGDLVCLEAATEGIDWDEVIGPDWPFLPRFQRRPLRKITKRAFDIVFSLLVLVGMIPLLPVIALAIWREDGFPVFFAHTRQSLHGREFPCYKFRTMCNDAERMKKVLEAENRCDGPQFFIENDPRLLRVGKFLRRCQLDELPQFWNVLRGDMSVVGPRPSPDNENQYCPAWREARLSVRPGVTGLWQVRRTREPQTDFQEWIRYDLEYVQRESWRMDIWIIAQTIRTVFQG